MARKVLLLLVAAALLGVAVTAAGKTEFIQKRITYVAESATIGQ